MEMKEIVSSTSSIEVEGQSATNLPAADVSALRETAEAPEVELAVERTNRRQPKELRTDLVHEAILVANLEGPAMAAPCDDRRAVGVPFERRRRPVAELEQSVELDGEGGVLLRLGSVGGGGTHRRIPSRCSSLSRLNCLKLFRSY